MCKWMVDCAMVFVGRQKMVVYGANERETGINSALAQVLDKPGSPLQGEGAVKKKCLPWPPRTELGGETQPRKAPRSSWSNHGGSSGRMTLMQRSKVIRSLYRNFAFVI